MANRICFNLVFFLLLTLSLTGQNPSTLVFPTQNPNPTHLSTPSYSRAVTSIKLKNGFQYGFVSSPTSSDMLNLSLGTSPTFVLSGYLGSGTNPPNTSCQSPVLPSTSNPVGETGGNFAVTSNGAATYNIPIVISPGTSGIQPDLSIGYNSQAGFGLLGAGWNLNGLSLIHRIGQTPMHDGAYKGVNLSASDIYAIDGNRLFVLGPLGYGSNGATYYTESETFATITSYGTAGNGPERFEVKNKDGKTFKYGYANNSSLMGIGNSTTLNWYLNEVMDEYGNYMSYYYKQLSGEVVLDRIEYTGNVGLTPYNTVKFDYIVSGERNSYYINGVEFKKTQLLKSITSYASSQLVRKYILDYEWKDCSYLASIREVEANGNELNPTLFCWANQNDNTGLQTNQSTFIFSNSNDYTDLNTIAADLDGDGFSDYVCFNTPGGRHRVMHNDFKNNVATSNSIPFSTLYDQISLDHTVYHLSSSVTDENKDNRQEVYSVISDYYGYLSGSIYGPQISVSQSYQILKTSIGNNGAVSISTVSTFTPSTVYEINFSKQQFLFTINDFTGDGNNDNLKITPWEIELTVNGSGYSYPLPNTQSIVRPFNFNADGKCDYIILSNSTPSIVTYDIISFTGTGFTTLYSSSVNFPLCSIARTRLNHFGMGDINGDGIDDLLYLTDSRDEMYICRGTGLSFLPPTKVSTYTPMNGPAQSDVNISVNDINGDGMADIAITEILIPATVVNNYYTYFSLGDQIAKGGSYTGNFAKSTVEYMKYFREYTSNTGVSEMQWVSTKDVSIGNQINIADLNGDGIADITSFVQGQETTITNAINKVKQNIQQIQTPLRKKIYLNYANINSEVYVTNSTKQEVYNKQSSTVYTIPLRNYKSNMYCVRSSVESSGYSFQISREKRYIYSDAIIHEKGRGFLGFEKVTTFDAVSNIGTVMKSDFNTLFYIPLPVEKTSGKIISSGTTNNGLANYILDNSQLISKELSAYNVLLRNTSGYLVQLTNSTSKDYLKSTQSTSTYGYNIANSGNLSSKSTTFGWPTAIKTVNELFTYTLKNGYYKISRKTIDQTQVGEPTYSRAIDYDYGDAEGHLTSTINDQNVSGISSNSIVTTTYENFNTFGFPTKTTVSAPNVASPRISEVNYDPTGRFVIKEIDALTNFKEYVYDNRYAQVIVEKGVTGLLIHNFYDGLGRLVKTVYPNQSQKKITYTWDTPLNYPYGSSQFGVYSVKTEMEANGYNKVYYSSNGEVLRSETQDYSGATVISDNGYDFSTGGLAVMGSLLESSAPHYMSQQKYLITHFEYEPIFYRESSQKTYSTSSNNPLLVTNTGIFNSTTYNAPSTDVAYSQGYVQTANQNGQVQKEINNGAGQVISIHNDATGYQQNSLYVYSSNGKPKTITLTTPANPGQNIIHSFLYDDLAQLKQKIDPSLGTINYTNNAIGEVLAQDDGFGQLSFQYDVLGRVTQRIGNISGTTTYQYVTSGNGLEMVDKIFGPNTTTEYKYDNFNRLTENKETVLVGGKILKSNYGYDNYGREVQRIYPSGIITRQEYNSQGYLTGIKDNNNQYLWQLINRDAGDRIIEYSYGNGLHTEKTYNDLNYLTEINFGNNTFHKQTYNYEPLTGNLKSRIFQNYKTSTNLKETFIFDSKDRLTKSSQEDPNSSLVIQVNNLTIDVLGNITHKDDAGDIQYNNPSSPFGITGISNYPANISVLTLNQTNNDLDKVQQLTEIGTNKQMDFVYGNTDERVKVSYNLGSTNQYTRYYSENYDREETSAGYKEWTYVMSPSGLCAVYYNNNGTSQLNYVLSDHLGSPVLITNAYNTPAILEEYSFDSWGRRRNPTDWSYNNIPVPQQMIRGYTLHEHIDEFTLINMNARIYDPVLGRFIEPDNADQDASDLQGYNRYAYCSNNPLKYIDPTGHYGEDPTYGYYNSNYYSNSSAYGGYNTGYSSSYAIGSSGTFGYNGITGTYNYGYSGSNYYNTSYTPQSVITNFGSSSSVWGGATLGGQSYSYSNSFSYQSSISYPNYNYMAKQNLLDAQNLMLRPAQSNVGSNWVGMASSLNGFTGFGLGVIENSSGISRIGSNLNIYGPTASGRVFYGNQYVKTIGVKGMAGVLGYGSLGFGMYLDYQGAKIYETQGANAPGAVNPGKAWLNTGVGVWAAAVGGFVGFTGGASYWGVDTFYPGGWNKAMENNASLIHQNQQILGPSWNIYRDH